MKVCFVCSWTCKPKSHRILTGDKYSKYVSEVHSSRAHIGSDFTCVCCAHCYSKINTLIKLDYDIQHHREVLIQRRSQVVTLSQERRGVCKTEEETDKETSLESGGGDRVLSAPSKEETALHSVQIDGTQIKDVCTSPPVIQGQGTSLPTYQLVILNPTPVNSVKRSCDAPELEPGVKKIRTLQSPIVIQPLGPTKEVGTQINLCCAKALVDKNSSESVKVVVKYPGTGTTITRVCSSDDGVATVIKCVAHNRSPTQIASAIRKVSKWKVAMELVFLKELKLQSQSLASSAHPSYLRETSSDDLMGIDWSKLIKEWHERAPLLYKVLQSITSKKNTKDEVDSHIIGVAGAILLFNLNQQMSLLQYNLGLLLDKDGATEETISLLHNLGLSVSASALRKKKKRLQERHREKMATAEDSAGAKEQETCAESDSEAESEVASSPDSTCSDSDSNESEATKMDKANGEPSTVSAMEQAPVSPVYSPRDSETPIINLMKIETAERSDTNFTETLHGES